MRQLQQSMSPWKAFATFVRFEILGLQPELRSFHEDSTANAVVGRLCSAVAQLPAHLYALTHRSSQILYMYNQWRDRLIKENPHHYHAHEDGPLNAAFADNSEHCELCNAIVELEDTHWACCTNGHQFGRCLHNANLFDLLTCQFVVASPSLRFKHQADPSPAACVIANTSVTSIYSRTTTR